MAELKTKPTERSVEEFLNNIDDNSRRKDCFVMLKIMKQITRTDPKMWGTSIVGFDSYHYKYKSGREGDWLLTGFSPRKQNLTIYIMNGFEKYEALLGALGKHKTAKSCLYIKKLSDVDLPTLKRLIAASISFMRSHYG